MTVPTTTITLAPEQVTVATVNEQGIKSVKNTNIENIQQIFMKEQAMETPLLPSQWGVVKYYRKNHYEGYVLTTPPTERQVVMDIRQDGVPREMTIPVPPLVWIFEVMTDSNNNKKLTHSMMYVIKHELLSLNDKVLHAPFPNLGVSHGICWGRENPSTPTSKSIQNLPARYFSQPFNNDLAHNRVKSFRYTPIVNGDSFETDNAVHHMVTLARELEESKEAGEDYSYPFNTLKEAGTMDVNAALHAYLPRIFN